MGRAQGWSSRVSTSRWRASQSNCRLYSRPPCNTPLPTIRACSASTARVRTVCRDSMPAAITATTAAISKALMMAMPRCFAALGE